MKASPIEWKIVQTYADGKAQRWIGPAGSEEPAARTEISDGAPRQDVVNVEEGGTQNSSGQSSGAATAAQSQEEDDDGTDWVPIALGAVALVVSAAALFVARRRTS